MKKKKNSVSCLADTVTIANQEISCALKSLKQERGLKQSFDKYMQISNLDLTRGRNRKESEFRLSIKLRFRNRVPPENNRNDVLADVFKTLNKTSRT